MNHFLLLLISIFCTVSEAKVLRISGIEGGPHFIYNPETSRPDGLVPKFVDTFVSRDLKSKFGLDIEWHQAPTARLLKELQSGKLDVLCFLIKTPEREKIYSFGKEPFFSGRPAMIVRKDFVKGNELPNFNAFKGKTIVMMSGVMVPDFIAENGIHMYPLTGFSVSDRTLSLLESKRIDGIFIHLHQVAEFITKQHTAKDTVKVVRLPGENFQIYLAFRKDIPAQLKDFLDQTFFKHREEYLTMLKK